MLTIPETLASLKTKLNLVGNAEDTNNKDASAGYPGKTLENINIWNTARSYLNYITAAATTASRTWELQNKSGTLAHTNDIPAIDGFFNGNMLIAQHGTSQALSTTFTRGSIDMWAFAMATTAAGTASQVTSGLTGIKYAAKLQRTNGSAATGALFMQTALEAIDSWAYQGKVVTVSFYAIAGTGFSSANGIFNMTLIANTNSEQASSGLTTGIGSWTGAVDVATIAAPVTSAAWVRHSFTGTVGNSIKQLGLQGYFTPVGTAGADDTVYITGVQIDEGTIALPFRQKNFTSSLRRCQRWFEKSFNYAVAPANAVGSNTAGEVKTQVIKAGAVTASGFCRVVYKVPKRIPGVVTVYNPVNNNSEMHDVTIGADCSSTFASSPQENGVTIAATGNASTAQGDVLTFHWSVDSGL